MMFYWAGEQVSPRFAYTGAVAALHKLRASDFVGSRRRHEEATPVCIDLPFDCDEVRLHTTPVLFCTVYCAVLKLYTLVE